MKTPEQLAEEYCNTKQLSYVERLVITKGFVDGYQAAKEETNLPTSAKWISVKDRLPRPGQEVLAFDNGIMRVQAISDHGIWHPYVNGTRCNPSHWMELPASPEEAK